LNKIRDYIFIETIGDTMVRKTPNGTDTLPIYNYVQGNATFSGAEIDFDIHPKSAKWLDFSASYSMTNGTLDAGGNLPHIPAGKLVGEIKLLKNKIGKFSDTYVSFIISNYAEQNNVAEYELKTEGYTLLDVHLGAAFKLGKQK